MRTTLSPRSVDALLFDLDGVLTPTAEVHMRAWERLFAEVLDPASGDAPYTDADYFSYLDGRPRIEGVRALLESRGQHLPEGTADDAPDAATLNGLGNRKNEYFSAEIRANGVHPFAGAEELLDRAEEAGLTVAVVSSSKNAVPVLEAAGLLGRFGLIVDGLVAASEGLAGKPAPDTFLYAARLLEVAPERAAVIEDAHSGVRAARAGRFGVVVGVDRGAGKAELLESGADLVVSELTELLPLLSDHDDEGE